MRQLEDAFGAFQAAQAHGAQVAQRGVRRKALADQRRHRLRQKDLAAVRGTHDARGAVDGPAKEVVIAALGHSSV